MWAASNVYGSSIIAEYFIQILSGVSEHLQLLNIRLILL